MWLDNLIGVFAPATAYRRVQTRRALTYATRTYEGAKTGRRVDGWKTSSSSANSELQSAGNRLRDRARDLVRNNSYAKKAKRIFTDNFIGEGIKPAAATGLPDLDLKIMAAWKDWVANCDADGNCDFYGLEALIVRSIFESGECFVRFKDIPPNGINVPFQLQVLEADFLDTNKNYEVSATGGYVRQGIEFNSQGQRVAYWMWTQHPGDNALVNYTLQTIRIPAEQILHIYEKDRPGQIRGVSAFAPVINRMRDLDDYDDAELWRKKIESCFAAFVIQNSGSEGPTLGNIASIDAQGNPAGTQANDNRVEAFRPGMVEYLKPGEDVRFGSPASDANYPNYQRVQLHAIAAGLGVTYEQLTGDLSQVNYSSLRAGLLEFRRMIETLRAHVFIPMFCNPVWKRFIDRAYIAGSINKIDYSVNWTPSKFEMIDPLKDAQADTLMMRNGTLTAYQAIAAQGYDPKTQLAEIAEINKLLDKDGTILDGDARKVSQAGISQAKLQSGESSNASSSEKKSDSEN